MQNASAAVPAKPNLVILMSDDQRWDTMNGRYMPNLTQLLAPNGVRLDQAYVSNPLCCPSRVSTLTGRYSYTTGVYGNRGWWGGFGAANRFGATDDTIATTLRADGYTTGLVGKYLNGYDPVRDYRTVPPGWDSWFEVRTGAYYDYAAAVDGLAVQTFASAPVDYSTRVLTDRALSFINTNAGGPFFLYFAPTAPHGPAIADPNDVGMFDSDLATYARPPSEQEADVSDKPAYVQAQPASPATQAAYDAFHAHQLAATYGVDRAIGAIWQALPDNTVVLFMSDNGYEWGEHRRVGKIVPYNESLRIPMLIASKGVDLSSIGPVGSSSQRIALNVDIRPTLESFVGDLPNTSVTDGASWTGSTPRQDFPIMHWTYKASIPVYCGVRSVDWMYVRYADGFEEAYDEQQDPFELNNLVLTDPSNAQLPILRSAARGYCAQQQGRIYPTSWPY
jgi:N-acetylglucosamine-6-sulfatase